HRPHHHGTRSGETPERDLQEKRKEDETHHIDRAEEPEPPCRGEDREARERDDIVDEWNGGGGDLAVCEVDEAPEDRERPERNDERAQNCLAQAELVGIARVSPDSRRDGEESSHCVENLDHRGGMMFKRLRPSGATPHEDWRKRHERVLWSTARGIALGAG